MDGVSKQTKASSKAAEEAFYGFSDFFKDVDKELAERRARRAGALLPAPWFGQSCRGTRLNLWAFGAGRAAGSWQVCWPPHLSTPPGRIEQCCCTPRVTGSKLILWALQERLVRPVMLD